MINVSMMAQFPRQCLTH